MIAANCQPPISNWPTPFSPSCIFHGALHDDAAVNALTWFAHRVWPELTLRLPQATFVIGGRGSRHRVQELGMIPGVILACGVFEESIYFSAATIAVFPYRYACTAQEDVLHALAMRKAVIATPVTVDGLGLISGVHVRVVNTTSDWIAVTYHLMLHPEVCAELGRAGGDWENRNSDANYNSGNRQRPGSQTNCCDPQHTQGTSPTSSHRPPVPASGAANELSKEGI